jgi:hypothetical protein
MTEKQKCRKSLAVYFLEVHTTVVAAFFLILAGIIYLQYQTLLGRKFSKKTETIIHGIGIMLIIGGIVIMLVSISIY